MPTLLVALDGSSFADASLPVAVGMARRLRADLLLVSVLDSDPWRYATGGAPFADSRLEDEHAAEWRTAVQRYLDGAAARIAMLTNAPVVHTRILTGPIADALVGCATAVNAAMLVVTTHGRGGPSRAWLGSVADALIRLSPVPVVAVRPADAPPPQTLPEWQLRRVLVPLDGSPDSESVLTPLKPLLADSVECVLMRAVSPLHPMLRAVATGAEYERDLAEQRTLVTRYLTGVEGALQREGVAATHCAPEEFDPQRAIGDCADSLDVDLIALATRGRGPVGRLLLGSVADKVLRTTSHPVLLHRMPATAAGGA
ncbi:MAG: universal stress protein [Gemmatimonas sp.]|jgi:nucleotide-binding universal stress UspA family protein|uniref:universal stress protein n=1 Tax=Gemmatimonas sp. TaxID=1962908 RepID=UPI0025BB6184|nr:universal stress protein [Gemmatimonas sp.]MCA2988754.1 universal stress protein [Gemmatimonas sp.]